MGLFDRIKGALSGIDEPPQPSFEERSAKARQQAVERQQAQAQLWEQDPNAAMEALREGGRQNRGMDVLAVGPGTEFWPTDHKDYSLLASAKENPFLTDIGRENMQPFIEAGEAQREADSAAERQELNARRDRQLQYDAERFDGRPEAYVESQLDYYRKKSETGEWPGARRHAELLSTHEQVIDTALANNPYLSDEMRAGLTEYKGQLQATAIDGKVQKDRDGKVREAKDLVPDGVVDALAKGMSQKDNGQAPTPSAEQQHQSPKSRRGGIGG